MDTLPGRAPRKKRRGKLFSAAQSLPEYALALALIVVLSNAVLGVFGRSMVQQLTNVDNRLNSSSDLAPTLDIDEPPVAPTSTFAVPTNTAVPPTSTRTPVPPTATRTSTPTNTPVPPTATSTPTLTPVPLCTVPTLTGVSYNTGKARWDSAGFTGSMTRASGSSSDTMTYQSSAAGTKIPCTSSVTVSRDAMCTVPTLTGMSYTNSKSTWQSAGFNGNNITRDGNGNNNSTMSWQSISPGQVILCSSSITVRKDAP
jgi:beta-lactam-binding protein with PASTA domain